MNLDLETEEIKQSFQARLAVIKEEKELTVIKSRQYEFIIKEHKDKIEHLEKTRARLENEQAKLR